MKLYLEQLESRDPASSFFGTKWTQTSLTYNVLSLSQSSFSTLPSDVVSAVAAEAFSLWSSYCPLSFTETTGPADINMVHTTIDGFNGVLVYTNAPTSGFMQFDRETWSVSYSGGIQLLQVMTHEIGHVLGLLHEDNVPSIMRSNYVQIFHGPGTGFLFPDDISGIQTLYGVGHGTVNSQVTFPATPPPTPSLPKYLVAFPVGGRVDSNGVIQRSFAPYPGYGGPISIGAYDINGDQVPDLLTCARNGHVQVRDGTTGVTIFSGIPIPVNGDHAATLGTSIVASALAGVVTIDPSHAQLTPFPGYNRDVKLAWVDSTLVCLADNGHLKLFGPGGERASFFAYPGFTGNIEVSGAFVGGQQAVATLAITGIHNHLKLFLPDGTLTQSYIT